MFDKFSSRLVIEGWLVTRTALRIGAGRATEPGGTDLPVIRDILDRPFIPGSSFKGVLRTHVESFVRAVVDGRYGACIPTGKDGERCLPAKDIKQGGQVLVEGMGTLRQKSWDDARMANEVWERSCLVCRTFGSPWLASHVQVRDLLVDEERWFGQFQVRDGVAIDRDTETVAGRQLYSYEVVPADTRFKCRIVGENLEKWQLGMLWLSLQPFKAGRMAVGGFRSRGLGQVRFAQDAPKLYFFSLNGNDAVDRLIEYLQDEKQQGEPVSLDQIEGWEWVDKFRHALKEARQKSEADQEANHAQTIVQ